MLNRLRPKYYKNYMEDWESPNQVIVCENGVFKKIKVNSICYVVKKTTFEQLELNSSEVEFDLIGETAITLEEKPYMLKKIPQGIVNTMLKFYQVYAQKGLEVKLNIWYDKLEDKFFLDCPFQSVTPVSIWEIGCDHDSIDWTDELMDAFPQKVKLKNKLKNKEAFIVLHTHSHHNLTCSFSSIDDQSDYFKAVGYKLFGVYKSVLQYPIFDLRYFVPPVKKSRPKTKATLETDVVYFDYSDIVDTNDNREFIYDFNEFARHVGYTEEMLFRKED